MRHWSFHCSTGSIEITFLNGARLHPLPPVDSKHPDVRYLHVTDDGIDEPQSVDRQASELPGEALF